MTAPARLSHSFPGEALITSFGYLHGAPPEAVIVVDVRQHVRDLHLDPTLRAFTGHDSLVVDTVLATPGARGLVDGLARAVSALLGAARRSRCGLPVRVAVGCAGGRHRSVVLAEEVAARLALAGWGAQAEHLHINRPVVGHPRSSGEQLIRDGSPTNLRSAQRR